MLRQGAAKTFHGEGILAITKALLQSGVAYVGGYQGAPVSHLLDVMVQAKPYLAELGVHVEPCANEASAAAMLGASIHYPLRGAVTWKSIVGTNVAADALSNLASPGVTGGALIIVGEDYGEGARVIQERTHAYALKSSLLLLDPRPELAAHGAHGRARVRAVRSVEHAGDPRAAHPRLPRARPLRVPRQRRRRRVSTRALLDEPGGVRLHAARASAGHVPAREAQGRRAHSRRAALHRRARPERARSAGTRGDVGRRSCRAASTTRWSRALQQLGLADAFGASRARRCSCSTSRIRWCPSEIARFCRGKRAVLVVEEGQPEYIEQEIARDAAPRATSTRRCTARTCCRRPASTRSR